ncbi:acyl carrier protein [Klebsiella michiganensis]|nr:acyl carrier protein [Klebsiella michiganensis]HBU6430624.1 acyl carrier protein [Klebsiella oxytoca]
MNDTLLEFISTNGKIIRDYFSFTNKVLDIVSNEPNQSQILLQLLEQTENITQIFLITHQQLLTGTSDFQGYLPDFKSHDVESMSTLKPSLNNETNEELIITKTRSPNIQSSKFSVEQTVKEVIAYLTGFSLPDIDLTLSFDELGLDSLGRLDMLEELLAKNPEINDYVQNLTNMNSPNEMVKYLEERLSDHTEAGISIEKSLFQHLQKISDKKITLDTPFSHYISDGFVKASIWEKLSSQSNVYHFAGEALMSRKNAAETVSLLNRIG